MDHSIPTTLAFNLRLSRSAGTDDWRVTVYDAQTGTYLRFASLAQLDAFLHIVTRSAAGADPTTDSAGEER